MKIFDTITKEEFIKRLKSLESAKPVFQDDVRMIPNDFITLIKKITFKQFKDADIRNGIKSYLRKFDAEQLSSLNDVLDKEYKQILGVYLTELNGSDEKIVYDKLRANIELTNIDCAVMMSKENKKNAVEKETKKSVWKKIKNMFNNDKSM